MKLIDKDALVAEIIRRRKAIPKDEDDTRLQAVYGNEAFVLAQLLEYIDTLEVKEVDLEKEIDKVWDTDYEDFGISADDFYKVAKHFFELALSLKNS